MAQMTQRSSTAAVRRGPPGRWRVLHRRRCPPSDSSGRRTGGSDHRGRERAACPLPPRLSRPCGRLGRILDRLAQDGYWAVAPAQRGYWPDGAAPDGSYRASATGQDALDLIEALGRDRADLIGPRLRCPGGVRGGEPRRDTCPQAVGMASLWPSTANRLARRR